MKKIEVLGVGCKKCELTAEELLKTASGMGLTEGTDFSIVKVKDPGDIAARGVLMTPGVAIDGKVVSTGRVPKRKDIENWLK